MNNKLFSVDQIQLVDNAEPLKAFATLKIANAFVVHNLRIVQGSKGLFVGMPREKGKGEGNEDKYYDIAYPITKESHKEISDLVLTAYQEKAQQPVKA